MTLLSHFIQPRMAIMLKLENEGEFNFRWEDKHKIEKLLRAVQKESQVGKLVRGTEMHPLMEIKHLLKLERQIF